MQTLHEEVKSIPHLKHHGGINRILTCGSPVDELLRVTLDLCRQHTYEGNRGCASHRSFTIQGRDIKQFHPAMGLDDGYSFLWDDPGVRFGAGERSLKRQHTLYMCLRGESSGHQRRTEQEVNRLRHVALPFKGKRSSIYLAPSQVEKRGLARALQDDIKAVNDPRATGLTPGQQRHPPMIGDMLQYRISGVGRLVFEVQARHEVIEQTASKHGDTDIRSL